MADLTITAGSVLFTSGTYQTRTAGAAITAGQAVYYDSSTDRLKLAQCDGTAAEVDAVGIALHGAASGQPLSYAGQGAVINIGATTAKGVEYVVSAAAGGVAPLGDLVSTNKYTRLGYATGTTGAFVVDIKNTGVTI